jgi:Uma2 family endonuclease
LGQLVGRRQFAQNKPEAMSTTANFSLEHYEHMVDVGVFAGEFSKRVELLRGEICQMNPIGFNHSQIVTLLTDWSYDVVPRDRMVIRVQNPIRIPLNASEPEPDLVWVRKQASPDNHPDPEGVLLLVEVADASLATDRAEKLSIYAEAGVADYWIVNRIDEQIEVYRRPRGSRYEEASIHRGDAEIRPLALPAAALQPSRIFD